MNPAKAILGTLIATCAGCYLSSAPKNDTGFAPVENLQSLVGCYANRGEGEGLRYLSSVIWPNAKLEHDKIKAIRVVSAGEHALRVTAESDGAVLKESEFVEGKDLTLNSEHVAGSSGMTPSFAYPSGNVFIGLVYNSQSLGLDRSGNARVQENTALAGTAFLVIPAAGVVRDAYRFPRAPALCT